VVALGLDIKYINKILFMIRTSRAIHFGIDKMIKNETKTTIINQGRGFQTKHILGDGQFKYMRKAMKLKGTVKNITKWDEHVNTLPFENLPHRLIIKIVFNAVFWLKSFPTKTEFTLQSVHTL